MVRRLRMALQSPLKRGEWTAFALEAMTLVTVGREDGYEFVKNLTAAPNLFAQRIEAGNRNSASVHPNQVVAVQSAQVA